MGPFATEPYIITKSSCSPFKHKEQLCPAHPLLSRTLQQLERYSTGRRGKKRPHRILGKASCRGEGAGKYESCATDVKLPGRILHQSTGGPLGNREKTQMQILMPCLPRHGWHSSRHRLHTSLGSAGREGASVIPRMWPGIKFASSSPEAWLLQASP